MLRVSRHLLRFEARGLLLGWGFVWCIPGVSARIWFGSGIPLTLSVIGVRSALSPLLWFSAPVGIHVQPVLQRISVTVCNVAEEFAKASLSFIVASLLEWLIEFDDSVEEMERRWGMIIGCNCVYRAATDRC